MDGFEYERKDYENRWTDVRAHEGIKDGPLGDMENCKEEVMGRGGGVVEEHGEACALARIIPLASASVQSCSVFGVCDSSKTRVLSSQEQRKAIQFGGSGIDVDSGSGICFLKDGPGIGIGGGLKKLQRRAPSRGNRGVGGGQNVRGPKAKDRNARNRWGIEHDAMT
ncbi:hypothetical protein B0H11DRAFT_1922730 [Mycena galericulata]|nr:hypothetical protein B0H11DRAFT_1922730 [Mycena galericulata]